MTAFWERPCILSENRKYFNYEVIDKLARDKRQGLSRDCWQKTLSLFEKLPGPGELEQVVASCSEDAIRLGVEEDLSPEEHQILTELLKELIPWRKGPFNFFGHQVDCEWRSNLKWDRVEKHIGDLEGRRVADIGCGNGYYMFRALKHNPKFILGLDPSEKFFFTFELVQKFLRSPKLQMEMLGVEHLVHFKDFFNVVLCMGVLYHQRNPLEVLKLLKESLRPRGKLVLEGQIIPGDEPVALFPPDRYGKARNVYFLPTVSCLEAWLARAGFKDISTVDISKTELDEQRRTEFAPFESLEDFLDKDDLSKTIEGWPAPKRALVVASTPS